MKLQSKFSNTFFNISRTYFFQIASGEILDDQWKY